jgi:hypothetical protein
MTLGTKAGLLFDVFVPSFLYAKASVIPKFGSPWYASTTLAPTPPLRAGHEGSVPGHTSEEFVAVSQPVLRSYAAETKSRMPMVARNASPFARAAGTVSPVGSV